MTILEIQVADTQEDLTELEGDVNFLFDEQVIQDERLFSLEQTSDGIIAELDSVDNEIEGDFQLLSYWPYDSRTNDDKCEQKLTA